MSKVSNVCVKPAYIKQARAELSYSQSELGEHLGVSRSRVRRIESGECKATHDESLKVLLMLKLANLIGGERCTK